MFGHWRAEIFCKLDFNKCIIMHTQALSSIDKRFCEFELRISPFLYIHQKLLGHNSFGHAVFNKYDPVSVINRKPDFDAA